jgi:hypothetical protein
MSFVLIFQPKTRYLNVTNFFLGRTQLGFTLFMYNLVLTEKEAIKSIFAKLIKNGKSGKTYFCHILIFAGKLPLEKIFVPESFLRKSFQLISLLSLSSCPGLPDGLFSNQKSIFGKIL